MKVPSACFPGSAWHGLEALEPRLLLDGTNPLPDPIPKGDIRIDLELVADMPMPAVALTDAHDASGRLFLATLEGTVWILRDGHLEATPFLDITDRTLTGGERGLLGMAFHPGFADPASPGYGKLYTYSSEALNGTADFTTSVPMPDGVAFDHQGVIAEWQVDPADPDRVDPSTRRELLRIDQPQSNHNGGDIQFGPDGYLYIALGDGGSAHDTGNGHSPGGNAQDLTNVYGSILRIDVDGAGSANGQYGVPADNPFVGQPGIDEIYAFGLRNPFRMGFDSETGALYAGDVGQYEIEEVDLIVSGGNYGWPLKEGTFRFDQSDGSISTDLTGLPPDLIDPLIQYDHDEGEAVIGGFVYRGAAIPELYGYYVFGDFIAGHGAFGGRIFYADPADPQPKEFLMGPNDQPLVEMVYSLAEDASGELYVLTGAGSAFRIAGSRPDLNVPTAAYPAGAAVAGSALGSVTFSVENGGDADAGAFDVAVHLSLDRVWGNADDVAVYTESVAGLVSGGTYAGGGEAHVPAGALAGDYYVGVKADASDALTERRKFDNVWWSSAPDVVVTVPEALGAKGVSLPVWTETVDVDQLRTTLDNLVALGADWIAVNVFWFQETTTSTAIAPDFTRYSAGDDAVRTVIDEAHNRGMGVMLKPVVDVTDDPDPAKDRRDISGSSAWFTGPQGYGEFIGHWADIAAEKGVEVLAVGTELTGTVGQEANWRALVADVRSRYAGPLVYAANHGSDVVTQADIEWWDALDYIGLDAYYPLTAQADPTLAELRDAWAQQADAIETWWAGLDPADRKPVLFTEVGYRSWDGTNISPGLQDDKGDTNVDEGEQAGAYRALFDEAWLSEPWLEGLFWWNWEVDPNPTWEADNWYTPQGKPAEAVLGEYYAGQSLVLTEPGGTAVAPGEIVPITWVGRNVPSGTVVSLNYDEDAAYWSGNEHWIVIDEPAGDGPGAYLWDTTGVAPGTYYVSGYMLAPDGTVSVSQIADPIVVRENFEMTSPAGITVTSGDLVPVTWTAADTGPTGRVTLNYDRDGVWWNGNETWLVIDLVVEDGTGLYFWDTTDVPPGAYFLSGYLLGADGLIPHDHTPEAVIVRPGPGDPAFDLTAPANVTAAPGEVVPIEWTLADFPAGTTISLNYDEDTTWWNGNETWIVVDLPASNGAGSYDWDTTGVAPGTYYVSGYAYDWADTVVVSQLADPVTIEVGGGSAQIFELTAPVGAAGASGEPVLIEWTALNLPAGSAVSLNYDEDTVWWNGNETWIVVDYPVTEGAGSYVWNTAGVPAGDYYISGYLLGGDGTVTVSQLTQAATLGPPQSFELTAPANVSAAVGDVVPIRWDAADLPAGSMVSLNYDEDTVWWNGNETWIVIDLPTSDGAGSYDWDTSAVAPGTYYVSGYLLGGNGVVSVSQLFQPVILSL